MVSPWLRRLCVFVAVAVASSGSVDAAACSESEMETIDNAKAKYSDSCNEDDACSPTCMTDLTAFVDSAPPDCEYSNGINYLSNVQQYLAECAPYTIMPVGSECSEAELATTDTYVAEFSDDGTCNSDTCSSECQALVARIAPLLPNCSYSNGYNYHDMVASYATECGGSSAASATANVGSVAASTINDEGSASSADSGIGSATGLASGEGPSSASSSNSAAVTTSPSMAAVALAAVLAGFELLV